MVQNYLRGAHGALLLFDTTSMTSFVNIQKWYQLLRKNDPLLPIILVGTKKDLEEFSMVGDYYAKLTQKKYNMIDYIKTSAKLDLNITLAFEVILKHLLKTSIIGWGDMDYERERKMNALREKVEKLNLKLSYLMQRLFQGGDDLSDVRIKYEGYRQQIDDINAELHELETEA